MPLYAIFQIALKSLLRNKTRTFLTMLGIIIGVAAVITMLAIGQGAKTIVDDQINSMGTNVITVMSNMFNRSAVRSESGSSSGLTLEDVENIKDRFNDVLYASVLVSSFGRLKYKSLNWYSPVMGVDTDFQFIRNYEMEEGEFFTDNDVRSGNKVIVIGTTVATNLFPDESPIDKMIRLRNVPVRIVGVYKSKGQSVAGGDQDDMVIAPYSMVLGRLTGRWRPNLNIFVSAVSKEKIPKLQTDIMNYLLETNRAATEEDFVVNSQTDIAETSNRVSNTMTLLLASIASISLLVGGIGIMNIMLVSVTERIKEIGIRMAVGAKKKDVLMQFIIEAVMISLLGGLLGILLGAGLSKTLEHMMKWSISISTWSIVLSVTFSCAIGIFFGWYPAKKAASLNLIDALRYE
ncbi:MAG TPA: ABC transporter permease [Candidatus Cloacimonadota bacterium]|nr:ABC transporter permease [Candidatus Cloacimonadota bacterium]HPK40253.1 ABC transporter permease [Candidatus Cloacimonadota bacterium]